MKAKAWFLVRESNGTQEYIGSVQGYLDWTDSFPDALALARRADADRLALIVDDCWQVKELELPDV